MPTLAEKREFARRMRLNATPAETALWNEMLSRRQFLGLKFRRQHVLLGWIVDFYCPEAGIVIEVDGGYHERADRLEPDQHRDETMYSHRLMVVRVQNEMVLSSGGIQAIKGAIYLALARCVRTGLVPSPMILCQGGRTTVPRWRGYSKRGSYRPAATAACELQPANS